MDNITSVTDQVASLKAQILQMEARKPSLKEILNAFMGIMMAGVELRAELATLPAPDVALPDPARLSAGFPLLSSIELKEAVPNLKKGTKEMLFALVRAFPVLKQEAGRLRSRIDEDSTSPAAWLEMLVRNEKDPLRALAEELGLEQETMRFALEQVFKPFLQWLADNLARHVEEIRWDRGYCPICGAYPNTSYLKRGEERQEYLSAHGARRWLHCSLCSYEWRLHRIVCPYCGNQDADLLEYFAAEESAHEKVYVCHRCSRYLTCMDTSEMIETPWSDLIPFELLHLDILAHTKGFIPLAWGHSDDTME